MTECSVASAHPDRFLLNIDEVSKAVGLARSTIEVVVREGLLEVTYYNGNKPMFRPSWVDAWIDTWPREKRAA